MSSNTVYLVKVNDVPASKVHPTLRSGFASNTQGYVSHFLSLNGRLTQKKKSIGWFPSSIDAQSFIEYIKPSLDNRGWGNYSVEVVNQRPDKWILDAMEAQKEERSNILTSQPVSPKPKQETCLGMFTISLKGAPDNMAAISHGYISNIRYKKLQIRITTHIADCKRYASFNNASRAIDKLPDAFKLQYQPKVKKLTQDEHQQHLNEKHNRWMFVKL